MGRSSRRSRVAWAAAVVAGALAVTACTGSPAPREGLVLTDAQIAALPEVQRRILADRQVTDAEFEEAVLAMVACLEESGIRVVEFDTRPAGWSIAYGAPGGDPQVESAVYDDCYDRSLAAVEPFYLAERGPTERERIEERTQFAACMREAGLDVREDAEWSELQELATVDPQSYVQCMDRVRRSGP